mmetsp:Transcript_74916/g.242237  ORF Transcript_74916/g.242237 Transcript_74916/m.242237 type:complete len:316 (+) Transcript_74916:523-1470(+)
MADSEGHLCSCTRQLLLLRSDAALSRDPSGCRRPGIAVEGAELRVRQDGPQGSAGRARLRVLPLGADLAEPGLTCPRAREARQPQRGLETALHGCRFVDRRIPLQGPLHELSEDRVKRELVVLPRELRGHAAGRWRRGAGSGRLAPGHSGSGRRGQGSDTAHGQRPRGLVRSVELQRLLCGRLLGVPPLATDLPPELLAPKTMDCKVCLPPAPATRCSNVDNVLLCNRSPTSFLAELVQRCLWIPPCACQSKRGRVRHYSAHKPRMKCTNLPTADSGVATTPIETALQVSPCSVIDEAVYGRSPRVLRDLNRWQC